MKRSAVILCILAGGFFLAACSGPRLAPQEQKSPFHDHSVVILARPETYSMTNLLRQLPGVSVTESLRNATVYVRGGQPLFIVDGVRIGHDFNDVVQLVNVQDVTAIELLRDPVETVTYGPGTANGVIIIHTKPFEAEEDL